MTRREHCFEECTFVIFGATGDLSRRKLLPAFYKLIEDNRLCKFAIIGVASSKKTPEEIITKAQNFMPNAAPEVLKRLTEAFSYHQMNFQDKQQYLGLKEHIEHVEKKHGLPGNKVFYFATMPEHFMTLTKNLVATGITTQETEHEQKQPWSRVVYEKPFGYDLASSKKINRYIAQVFDESQVFRVDHYLGKELVGNIAMTRFTNRVFEPLWNNKHIESVDIAIKETIGIEQRGSYFDAHGTINDMVQSHLLQLLALTAMEAPQKLSATFLRNAKAQVLKKVVATEIVRGQYEGYRNEDNVNPSSTTETFASINISINNKRWKGVPFRLLTGKYLDKKEAYIEVTFKQAECLLEQCPSQPNKLRINIQPNDGIYLHLNAKALSSMNEAMPVKMEFCHSCLFGPNTPAAYEVLLADVVKGDQSAFVRNDEIEYSWKIVDAIKKQVSPLKTYKRGTPGPT